MAVRFYNEDVDYKVEGRRQISAWLKEVASLEGYTLDQVSYIFCSAEHLLQMNRQHLGHDYYTDVITFDYSDRKGAGSVAGDIFIDVETVADNARLYGQSYLTEMRRVMVHGLLHLCGQRDKTKTASAHMHRKENRYLKLLRMRIAERLGATGESAE